MAFCNNQKKASQVRKLNVPKIAKNIKTTAAISMILMMSAMNRIDLISKIIAITAANVSAMLNLSKIMLNAAKKSIMPKNLAIIESGLREDLKCFW